MSSIFAYPLQSKDFWRVQHPGSFTGHDDDGFHAQSSYYMNYSHWLNKAGILGHLDWSGKTGTGSPFISVFDNSADAQRRKILHQNRGIRDVTVFRIHANTLQQHSIDIRFQEGVVHLPAWRDHNSGVVFLHMRDVARVFNIDFRLVQGSEWLVLDGIPGEMCVEE